MLPHAPGVQMANIPEDGIKIDEGEAADEANPDKRLPKEVNTYDEYCVTNTVVFLIIDRS